MSDDETAGKGLLEAHTPADPAGDGAAVAAPASDAASIAPGAAEEPDLSDGLPDLGGTDLLALAAETVAGPARTRGRPRGSANKRNMDMVAYLAAMGHRDPMVTLSMIQTADTVALAKAMGVDTPKGRLAVLGVQRQAANDMLPYFYAKKPQQLELPEGGGAVQHFIAIGELNVHQADSGGIVELGGLAPVRMKKPNEINGDAVREKPPENSDDE